MICQLQNFARHPAVKTDFLPLLLFVRSTLSFQFSPLKSLLRLKISIWFSSGPLFSCSRAQIAQIFVKSFFQIGARPTTISGQFENAAFISFSSLTRKSWSLKKGYYSLATDLRTKKCTKTNLGKQDGHFTQKRQRKVSKMFFLHSKEDSHYVRRRREEGHANWKTQTLCISEIEFLFVATAIFCILDKTTNASEWKGASKEAL